MWSGSLPGPSSGSPTLEEGRTLPVPFNLVPSPKSVLGLVMGAKSLLREISDRHKAIMKGSELSEVRQIPSDSALE